MSNLPVLTQAIALHEQTLADYERVLGPDHPYTLHSRDNLATSYRAAGRNDDAENINHATDK